jgi:hypothetical protein
LRNLLIMIGPPNASPNGILLCGEQIDLVVVGKQLINEMKHVLLALVITFSAFVHAWAGKKSYVAGQVNVTANDVIYAATLQGTAVTFYLTPSTGLLGSGGSPPQSIELPPGATYVTFQASGGITMFNNDIPSSPIPPEGTFNNNAYYFPGDNFVSGINVIGKGFLSGVFVNGKVSEDHMMMPPALDFTQIQNHFENLEPQRNQQFYIGDGLTGDGQGDQQRFWVPKHATKLVLGIPDWSYGHNAGQFTVDYSIQVISEKH